MNSIVIKNCIANGNIIGVKGKPAEADLKKLKLQNMDKNPCPVIVESPYSGDIELNIYYARLCMLDSYKRNEAPFLGHLLYTQISKDMKDEFLHDEDEQKQLFGREHGLLCNYVWREKAKKTIFYTDLGWSSGMKQALEECYFLIQPMEERKIENWEELKKNFVRKL